MFRIGRQADVIERRYNKLIEQKTVFARRAAARIRYIMLEGADGDDRTAAFVSLLNRSGRKEEIIDVSFGTHQVEQALPAHVSRTASIREKPQKRMCLSLRLWSKEEQVGRTDGFLCAETALYP